MIVNGLLKDGNANIGRQKIYMLCSYFTKRIFTLVAPYVSIFAEIPLTPASPERSDERSFLKCRPRFKDSMEMEQ